MEKYGTLVVISGNSGTGKSYLQDNIIEFDSTFEQVPKYLSKDKPRNGEVNLKDKFAISKEQISENCTWFYKRNGNFSGFNESDILEIIENGKNAIIIATNIRVSYQIRNFCKENNINLFKIYLDDPTKDYKAVEEILLQKGRDVIEAKKRQELAVHEFNSCYYELDFCDIAIENIYDVSSNTWKKGKNEMLKEFYEGYNNFLRKSQEQLICFEKMFLLNNSCSIESLRKAFLEKRWSETKNYVYVSNGEVDFNESLNNLIFSCDDEQKFWQIIKKLNIECIIQDWIDDILLNYETKSIYAAALEAQDSIPENDMEIRKKLKQDYLEKLDEINDPNNETVKQLYNGLVNILPLIHGETIGERLNVLRKLTRKKERKLPEHLNRKLIEISEPYHFRI